MRSACRRPWASPAERTDRIAPPDWYAPPPPQGAERKRTRADSDAPMQSDPSFEKRLVFLIGPPRSGSTLLARMLGAHSAVCAPEEPHLITPPAHLGYFASVESAPYDPVITRPAARALVAELPGGEAVS